MNEVDILEQWLVERNPILMDMLLRDRTTGGRIKWATANYEEKGENYFPNKEITVASVSVVYADVIQPRATKKNDEKLRRTKDNAEVFTPSWTCNCQNNLIDAVWFGRENVFNTEFAGGWVTNEEKIEFPENKMWKDYVMANRMEITCGEAPYLVSRYDAVTGEEIQVRDRIGLLDRKLRVINENVDNKREWYKWVKRAYRSVYGYDYQGDNVVLARENLLYTLIDNRNYKFGDEPTDKQLIEIAEILSWNIWQMDGLTYTTPYSEVRKPEQLVLIYSDDTGDDENVNMYPKDTIVYDWENKKEIKFKDLVRGY